MARNVESEQKANEWESAGEMQKENSGKKYIYIMYRMNITSYQSLDQRFY